MCEINRILVVDDFEPFRSLVASLLQGRNEWQIIAEATDGCEAVEKALELRPELILLDIGLPKINGIQAAREIVKTSPQCKIIFLTQETSADVVQEAVRLRASGYVAKVRAQRDLIAAIEAVLAGKSFFSVGTIADSALHHDADQADGGPN